MGELKPGSVVAIAGQGYIGATIGDFVLKFEFVSELACLQICRFPQAFLRNQEPGLHRF